MFSDDILDCKTMEEEVIDIVDVRHLSEIPKINNLNFLIPMALDKNVIESNINLR